MGYGATSRLPSMRPVRNDLLNTVLERPAASNAGSGMKII
jgi:hypothetical protein